LPITEPSQAQIHLDIFGAMRQVLFLAYMGGLLLALDAGYFEGRYRADIWQQTKHQGEVWSREVERRIKEAFR
jgi:hypothetical protein